MEYQKKNGVIGWLAVMLSLDMHMTLISVEFHDGLWIRMGPPLLRAPTHCDGCGDAWSIYPALSCPHDGLVNFRHNEVWEEVMEICCMAYTDSQVYNELLNLVHAPVAP